MTKLKPCPFCGNEVSMVLVDDSGNIRDPDYGATDYAIYHPGKDPYKNGCVLETLPEDVVTRGIYNTEEECAEAWNRRI